jgi:NAD-dependent deacetylase
MRCYHVFEAEPFIESFLETQEVPHCTYCTGVLKPNVILFGEQLPVRVLEKAKEQTRLCDVMLVAGSSLVVSPVCDLPLVAIQNGARLIIVNFEETYADQYADVVIHADVVEVLPQLAAAFP